jgi:RNA polymerase sigma-70 factor (ECF subfamily)
MARVASGDAAAFRLLVERHSAMVHALAWRMLGAADAEDVVQESFTRLWVNAKGWAPAGGGLGGWLRRVATNLCLDRLRRPRTVGDDLLAGHRDEAPPADVRLDEARRQATVADAVRALPDRQRAAIVLTYYEGVSNAEAAAILGLGVKAVESLLVRARQALIRMLAGQGLVERGGTA